MKRSILLINKLLAYFKLAIISVLLFISGNALAQQANTSTNTTIKQDAITASEDSSQIFGQQTIYPLYPGDQGELLKYINTRTRQHRQTHSGWYA